MIQLFIDNPVIYTCIVSFTSGIGSVAIYAWMQRRSKFAGWRSESTSWLVRQEAQHKIDHLFSRGD